MIPRSFRIHDFRSIVDSGICTFSGDNITVLAGQNEAGKTAILIALRDFDLEEGMSPQTPEFMPEGRYDAQPRVAVEFESNIREIKRQLIGGEKQVPKTVIDFLTKQPRFWIERNLLTGKFSLDSRLQDLWPESTEPSRGSEGDADSDSSEFEVAEAPEPENLGPSKFASFLRNLWPLFIYFDSFEGTLPREVYLETVAPHAQGGTPAEAHQETGQTRRRAPQAVSDFITLSSLDLSRVETLSTQDKALGNYLRSCGATITGDFLTYWKQKIDGDESVDLYVRHVRDEEGKLKLAFYIHDRVDQYPEQRSKGFLWFLSFYLRLAAAEKRDPDRRRLLLIDEPGSYLHARAQRDVLHLFEDRIANQQQIVYSTHSPFLLPADKLHRIRIVLKKSLKGTLALDRLTHPELRGDQFADTLSPVISAIGLDIREAISFAKNHSVLVEGISDHLYITTWARHLKPAFLEQANIFPGYGATTLPTLASLFIGWGLTFIVLLDRDKEGTKTKEKFIRELALPVERVVQPRDATAIEDLIAIDDFRTLLGFLDTSLTITDDELPSAAIKRQKVDKILLARTFAEKVDTCEMQLSATSQDAITRLLNALLTAM